MKRQIVSWEKRTNEIMRLCGNEVNLLGGFWCQKERGYIDTEKEGFNPELFPLGIHGRSMIISINLSARGQMI